MSIDLSVSENERLKEQDSIQCLRYSNSNSNSSLRNALVIGYSKKVTLFDVINQKVIKTLRLSKYDSQGISEQNQLNSNGLSLTALAVNQRLGRDHVAVGGKYGHLRIISLTSEISGAPSVDNKIQDIINIKYRCSKLNIKLINQISVSSHLPVSRLHMAQGTTQLYTPASARKR